MHGASGWIVFESYQLSNSLIGDRNIVSVWSHGRRKNDHASLRHATRQ